MGLFNFIGNTMISGNGGGAPFNPDTYFDLINLKSNNASQFTLVSSTHISAWNGAAGVNDVWSQGTDANRPLLTAGVPTFDGVNDVLTRALEVSATTHSLYFIFKNLTSVSNKVILGSSSDPNNFIYTRPDYTLGFIANNLLKIAVVAGINTNNRPHVISVRRAGNTFVIKINGRTGYIPGGNSYAGEASLIGRLMTSLGGFFMNGGLLQVGMSSQNLSDIVDNQITNSLYNTYNLGSVSTPENVCGFGDSNTSGGVGGVTSYIVNLATSLSVAPFNIGIPGSWFTDGVGSQNSGFTRYPAYVLTKPYKDYISIGYGSNDVGNSVSPATFGTEYNTMIAQMISLGYPPRRILINTPAYLGSTVSGGNQHATDLDNYRAQLVTIKNTYGTSYFDLLQYMRDNGGDTTVQADGVHLTQAMQNTWATQANLAFTS